MTVLLNLALSLLLIVLVSSVTGCSTAPIGPSASHLCKSTEDLGAVKQGSKFTRTFTIKNIGPSFEIARFKSSCPCVTPKLEQPTVPANGEVKLLVSVDLAEEPDFIGDLMISIEGYTPSDKLQLEYLLSLSVVANDKSTLK